MSDAKVIETDDGEVLVQMPYKEGCREYCIGWSYGGLLLVGVSSPVFLMDVSSVWLEGATLGFLLGISVALVTFIIAYTLPCRFYELMEGEPNV